MSIANDLLALQEKEQLLSKKVTRAEVELESARKEAAKHKIKSIEEGEKLLEKMSEELEILRGEAQGLLDKIEEVYDELLNLA